MAAQYFATDELEVEWLGGRRMACLIRIRDATGNGIVIHIPTSVVKELALELAKSEMLDRMSNRRPR